MTHPTYGARFVAELQRLIGIESVCDATTMEMLRRATREQTIEMLRWELTEEQCRQIIAREDPEALAREVHTVREATTAALLASAATSG